MDIRKILKHIFSTRNFLRDFAKQIWERAEKHDQSWLLSNEEYGRSEEDPVWQKHHYKINSNHPEYHGNDINKMTLLDIIEMYADWVVEDSQGEPILDKYKEYNIKNVNLEKIFENTRKMEEK